MPNLNPINLSPVSLDHFVRSVVALEREVDLENVVAGLDDAQDPVDLLAFHLGGDTHLAQLFNLVKVKWK